MSSESALLERVHTIMPGLVVKHYEINQEGTLNDVLIVNQEIVFRFAKNERFARVLQDEIRILAYLHPRLDLRIPEPVRFGSDYMVYPILAGQPLLLNRLISYSESVQRSLAQQLGTFLYSLHSLDISDAAVDVPISRAPISREDCLNLYADVKDKIYPLLQKDQVEWAENLFGDVLQVMM